MASFKFVLRKQKKRKNGEIPIYLRIIKDRKPRFLSTKISIPEKDWNENKERVRASHSRYKILNDELERLLAEAQSKYTELKHKSRGNVSSKRIKNEIVGKSSSNFIDYIDDLAKTFNYWQKKKYNVLINKLERFRGHDITFSDIDHSFLRKFDHWLETEVGNAQNTRSKELSRIRRVLNTAMDERIISSEENPFVLGFKLEWEEVDALTMNKEELLKFKNVKLKEGSKLWHYQKTFIFALSNDGMRIGDVLTTEWDNIHEETLRYRMMKTDKIKELRMSQWALDIVDWYKKNKNGRFVFPYLDPDKDYDEVSIRKDISSKTVLINRGLKKIAEMAELRSKVCKNFSTHLAPHTFTFIADEAGWSLTEIQEARRHSNPKQTRDYIGKLRKDRLDPKRKELFS